MTVFYYWLLQLWGGATILQCNQYLQRDKKHLSRAKIRATHHPLSTLHFTLYEISPNIIGPTQCMLMITDYSNTDYCMTLSPTDDYALHISYCTYIPNALSPTMLGKDSESLNEGKWPVSVPVRHPRTRSQVKERSTCRLPLAPTPNQPTACGSPVVPTKPNIGLARPLVPQGIFICETSALS